MAQTNMRKNAATGMEISKSEQKRHHNQIEHKTKSNTVWSNKKFHTKQWNNVRNDENHKQIACYQNILKKETFVPMIALIINFF